MTTLYGIPNCSTIKKARRWLDQHEAATATIPSGWPPP
jgi:arsenate reductase-like glutaredoxin family protein